jgi:hypothetical protein
MTNEQENEVARLRKYVELIEIFSPANEWSQPEWRKLVGSKEENEDLETLFRLYQFRLATTTEDGNDCYDRMVEIKLKQASIIAAVNFCITEYPSDRASVYLAPIMEELFSK